MEIYSTIHGSLDLCATRTSFLKYIFNISKRDFKASALYKGQIIKMGPVFI